MNLITNTVTVVGAVATTVHLYPIPDNTTFSFTAKVAAFDSADGEAGNFETKFTVKRFAAGVATVVGVPVPIIVNADDVTWALTVGVDGGNNARVQFTAGAGDTVIVRGELEFIQQP